MCFGRFIKCSHFKYRITNTIVKVVFDIVA